MGTNAEPRGGVSDDESVAHDAANAELLTLAARLELAAASLRSLAHTEGPWAGLLALKKLEAERAGRACRALVWSRE
ncbi:MAG TPA: hypothetical protein VGM56_19495, partial [Byssovorax sp.]